MNGFIKLNNPNEKKRNIVFAWFIGKRTLWNCEIGEWLKETIKNG